MTTYRLEVSQRAESDADSIYLWIAERSPAGASRWHLALREALQSLTERPTVYPPAVEDAHLGIGLRERLFGTTKGGRYRALYVLSDDVVRVLAIRGVGQDLVDVEELA